MNKIYNGIMGLVVGDALGVPVDQCGGSGEKGIPQEWIKQIARKDWIFGLCKNFENKLSKIDVT